MRTPRRDGEETRGRILAAAAAFFAEVGYREAKVALIAERAGVNHAAINYHFGGKDDLYRQVWTHAAGVCLRAYPLEPPGEKPAPVREQLRQLLRSMIRRSFDPGPAGHLPRLLAYELTERTPGVSDLCRETLGRHDARLRSIVGQVLGREIDEETLALCRMLIVGPAIGLGIRLVRHPEEQEVEQLRRIDPDRITEEIFQFVWAGLRDLQRRDLIARREGRREKRQ
jgi:AcrR family transcriptional regulator